METEKYYVYLWSQKTLFHGIQAPKKKATFHILRILNLDRFCCCRDKILKRNHMSDT